MSGSIRVVHRWTSLVFVLVVGAIFGSLSLGREPSEAVYLAPLAPLFLLMLTGMWMFAEPWVRRRAGPDR